MNYFFKYTDADTKLPGLISLRYITQVLKPEEGDNEGATLHILNGFPLPIVESYSEVVEALKRFSLAERTKNVKDFLYYRKKYENECIEGLVAVNHIVQIEDIEEATIRIRFVDNSVIETDNSLEELYKSTKPIEEHSI